MAFDICRRIKTQRDESNNCSRKSSSDNSKICRTQRHSDYMLTYLGMNKVPAPAPVARAIVAGAAPAEVPAPAATMQAQVRALINPLRTPTSSPNTSIAGSGPCPGYSFRTATSNTWSSSGSSQTFWPTTTTRASASLCMGWATNSNANWRAERLAGRQTQDSISNHLGGSLDRTTSPISLVGRWLCTIGPMVLCCFRDGLVSWWSGNSPRTSIQGQSWVDKGMPAGGGGGGLESWSPFSNVSPHHMLIFAVP